MPELKSNDLFNFYYDDFGNIFDYLNNNNIDQNFIESWVEKYKNKSNVINSMHLSEIKEDNEAKTLSQLKARIGIIVSYYLSLNIKNKTKFEIWRIYLKFSQIWILIAICFIINFLDFVFYLWEKKWNKMKLIK